MKNCEWDELNSDEVLLYFPMTRFSHTIHTYIRLTLAFFFLLLWELCERCEDFISSSFSFLHRKVEFFFLFYVCTIFILRRKTSWGNFFSSFFLILSWHRTEELLAHLNNFYSIYKFLSLSLYFFFVGK